MSRINSDELYLDSLAPGMTVQFYEGSEIGPALEGTIKSVGDESFVVAYTASDGVFEEIRVRREWIMIPGRNNEVYVL